MKLIKRWKFARIQNLVILKGLKRSYTFLGWYDENNNLLEENTKITDDTVYYAKWAVIVTDDEETE